MKKRNRALASATVLSLVLTSTVTVGSVQAVAEVTRVPGANRETTSMEVAKQVFKAAETVVLVNGYGYADAVSATPLAKALNAPILLTNKVDAPTAELTATLAKLGAKNVVIVGGSGAVTEAMAEALGSNYSVKRIGGASRYETNALAAKEVLAKTGAKAGILVSAEGYADALSVASIAAAKGMPVLFGNSKTVPAEVQAVAEGLEVVAVGGEAVLPASVLSAVDAARVAQGANRFETNLAVLKHFKADLKLDNIYVAAGGATTTGFADALVASAAAAKTGAPVVLTGAGANAIAKENATDYIVDNMTSTTKVTVIGGTASISEAIVKDIKEAAELISTVEDDKPETIKITDVQTIDLDTEVLKPENITVQNQKGVTRIYDLSTDNANYNADNEGLIYLDLDNNSDFNGDDIALGKLDVTTSSVYDDDDKEVKVTIENGKIVVDTVDGVAADSAKFQPGTTGTIVVRIIDTADTDNDGDNEDVIASKTITIDIEK